YASKGYDVTAVELTDANIAAFQKKITSDMKIDLRQGNALDLSMFSDESFDVVLLMGPLYHLKSDEDKLQTIAEAKRVCKKDGMIFFAFITNDFVMLTELSYDINYFKGDTYEADTFRVKDEPFVFATIDKARSLMEKANITIQKEVAVDGATELIQDLVDKLDEESYQQYIKFHFYICEKKEFLGMTNHLLLIGR
ncbi:MAG: class I SAM-dependent methyltransferase, partial [Bacteroidales bacterium]|nr:class I SAM-dependent methyltransferase [Bacteroidales bacterium]